MCLEHSIFEHPTETGSQSTKHGDRFRNVSLFLNFEVLLKITCIHKKKSDVLHLALATSPFLGYGLAAETGCLALSGSFSQTCR